MSLPLSGTVRTRTVTFQNDNPSGPEVGDFQIAVDNGKLVIRRFSSLGTYQDIQTFEEPGVGGPTGGSSLGFFQFQRDVTIAPGNNLTITNGTVELASAPVSGTDAVNKAYVDSLVPATLSNMSGVAIASPAEGDVLTYIGSQWVNVPRTNRFASETFHYSGTGLNGSSTIVMTCGAQFTAGNNVLLPALPFAVSITKINLTALNVPNKSPGNHVFVITVNRVNAGTAFSDSVTIPDSSKVAVTGGSAVFGSKTLSSPAAIAAGETVYVTIGGYNSSSNNIGVAVQLSGTQS
eukprot:jgi/Mesvir1/22166/Mv18768-RA.1